MSAKTQKPRYQILNEARTQGHFTVRFSTSPTEVEILGPYLSNKTIAQFDVCKSIAAAEAIANAQYTTLAVNNLHELASALEKFTILNEAHYKDIAGLIKNAKQALAMIS